MRRPDPPFVYPPGFAGGAVPAFFRQLSPGGKGGAFYAARSPFGRSGRAALPARSRAAVGAPTRPAACAPAEGKDSRPPVCFGPVRPPLTAASIQVPVNQTSVPERRLVGRMASAAFGGPLPGYSLGRAAWAGRRRADPVLRLVRSPTRNSGSCGLSLFRMSGRGYKKWHPVPGPSRVYCRIRQLLCSS